MTGDPRDPATKHRATAAYNRWFRPTAGSVLAYAMGRTRSKDCAAVRANFRLRLGAVETAENRGRRNGVVPFANRVCSACQQAGERHIDDVQHVCFECPHIKGQLQRSGWDSIPGVGDFAQLYAPEQRKAGVRFVGRVVGLIAEQQQRELL